MNLITKILCTFLTAPLMLLTNAVLANQSLIQSDAFKGNTIQSWHFNTQNDGISFILGEYDHEDLVIRADSKTAKGEPADIVTVSCNGTEYQLAPGSSITCHGNFHDTGFFDIKPADFKNGAQGTYEYIPVTQ